MRAKKTPSEALLVARRSLEGMSSVLLLQDWTWSEQVKEWVLHCRLSLDISKEGLVPISTDWYVLVTPQYPWGDIKFYPAKQKGLTQTFPHQNFNSYGDEQLPWRDGKLCLITDIGAVGRQRYDIEPYDVNTRLYWHFQRAVNWLIAASEDNLAAPYEHFELPHFPLTSLTTVTFSEGDESFVQWENISARAGLVELVPFSRTTNLFFVKSFQSMDGRELLTPTWGKGMTDASAAPIRGIWLRLKNIPIVSPWQAPSTWKELRVACRSQGIDLDDLLKPALKTIRDKKKHIVLIGFPIPSLVNGLSQQIHWQALLLPVLSQGTKTAKGFRTNEEGYWRRDYTNTFCGKNILSWIVSENWHVEQITTRGKLPKALTAQKILLLGAGAVGSSIAELLCRGNVHDITIVDPDILEVGNLTRNSLDLQTIKMSKAYGMAYRLNLISPHAAVEAISAAFPVVKEAEELQIQKCNIVVDCTGSDAVLHNLESFPWSNDKIFFSISIGLGGKRLFCFSAYGSSFPHTSFRNMINPWLGKELQEYDDQELPREGIGCWHPVFPARADDIWMMASTAVKHIESLLKSPIKSPDLAVFEQVYENSSFVGIHQVYTEVGNG
ncbi:ThiF family adenylyltransferase [Synechocystis sp. PCC 7509]|uniref:ThiF family adenylyltransferase n=1 Tax=Synechocystis sp. PCC 7509 TaxID=927677 RepID=UPI0002ABAD85|nr:ThiF family adenylyltransferase [Synechocystis sp. PCC 7509]